MNKISKRYYSLSESVAKVNAVNPGFKDYQAFMKKLTSKGRLTTRLSQANPEIERMSAEEAGIALLEMTRYLKRGYAGRADETTKDAWRGTMSLLSRRIDSDYSSRQDTQLERSLVLVRPDPEPRDPYRLPSASRARPRKLARAGSVRTGLIAGIATALVSGLIGYTAGISKGYVQGLKEGEQNKSAQTSTTPTTPTSQVSNQQTSLPETSRTSYVEGQATQTQDSTPTTPAPAPSPISTPTIQPTISSSNLRDDNAFEVAKSISGIPFSDLTTARVIKVDGRMSRLENALEVPFYVDGLVDTREEVEGIVNAVALSFHPASSDPRFSNPNAFEDSVAKTGIGVAREYESDISQVTSWDLSTQLDKAIRDSENGLVLYTDKDGNESVIGSRRSLQRLLEVSQ